MRSLALEASIALICRAKLLRIISASAGSFQHREKFVGDLELASLQAEWRHGGEGFQLLGRMLLFGSKVVGFLNRRRDEGKQVQVDFQLLGGQATLQ